MQCLEIQPLCFSSVEKVIKTLPKIGQIKIAPGGFSYVDVDDDFIHQVYPFIQHPSLFKPDYFDEKTYFIGAHISLTYPGESTNLIELEKMKGRFIEFDVEGLFTADVLEKRYYALKIKAPELLEIRSAVGLSDQLMLNNFLVDLHITVAFEINPNFLS